MSDENQSGTIHWLLRKMFIGFLSMLILIAKANAQVTYEIFITQGNVQTLESDTTVYHIKQGDNLLVSINQQLKRDGIMDEETAATYVTQQLQEMLVNQMTGLTKAAQYQLKYFPAIVKDGQYVIYGTTDPKAFDDISH